MSGGRRRRGGDRLHQSRISLHGLAVTGYNILAGLHATAPCSCRGVKGSAPHTRVGFEIDYSKCWVRARQSFSAPSFRYNQLKALTMSDESAGALPLPRASRSVGWLPEGGLSRSGGLTSKLVQFVQTRAKCTRKCQVERPWCVVAGA